MFLLFFGATEQKGSGESMRECSLINVLLAFHWPVGKTSSTVSVSVISLGHVVGSERNRRKKLLLTNVASFFEPSSNKSLNI